MKTLAAVLILVASAAAQSAPKIPDAPSHVRTQWEKKPANVWLSPFKDPFFYAGTAAHAAGVGVDVHFVQNCEQAHTCVEANPGADKWKNRIPEIALGTLGRYGCSLMLKDHKYWRAVCLIPSVAIAAYDIVDGTKIHRNQP